MTDINHFYVLISNRVKVQKNGTTVPRESHSSKNITYNFFMLVPWTIKKIAAKKNMGVGGNFLNLTRALKWNTLFPDVSKILWTVRTFYF